MAKQVNHSIFKLLTKWLGIQDTTKQDERAKGHATHKHVLITIHGFGKKQSKEMQYIKQWGEDAGWDVVLFDMFEEEVKSLPDFERWMQVAKEKVEAYLGNNVEVNLLGFSMGGVIASYLASQLPICRLILLAPAFDYINLDTASRLLALSATSLLKDSELTFIKDLQARILPVEYFPQFIELVHKYKDAIADVSCPVLFIHVSEDEIISVRSSKHAYHSIKHNNKRLFVIEDGSHQLMLDSFTRNEVFALIKLFLSEEIVGERE